MYKTKIRKFLSPNRILAFAGLIALVVISIANPLAAQDAGTPGQSTQSSTPFTQGYGSDEQLERGMIVRLVAEDTTKVKPLTFDEMDQMLGVVVDANDAPVTLSAEGQKVFVATGGRFDVLVSSQNGPINAGDYITISAFNGIGMKAGNAEPIIVGRALAAFDGNQGVVSSAEITDTEGQTRTVNIARLPVDISVSRNPLLKIEEPDIPEVLRRASEAIAGKQVDPIRVYLGLAVFIISSIAAGTLMYGGVRSGIISIGRNPLSKKSIVRSMIQVIITGLIIFISGLFGVYLILRL